MINYCDTVTAARVNESYIMHMTYDSILNDSSFNKILQFIVDLLNAKQTVSRRCLKFTVILSTSGRMQSVHNVHFVAIIETYGREERF